MKINKRIFIFLILVLIMLCAISTVSATEPLNENLTSTDGDGVIDDNINDELGISDNEDALSEGNTITVSRDGTGDYDSISAAVSNANGGDTIFIKNGEYVENSTIKFTKSVNLVGESKDGVSLKLSQSGSISLIESNTNGIVLSFKNLIFKDSTTTGGSGIIRFYGSVPMDINFTDCTFNNLVNKYCLQFATTGTTNIIGCKFENIKCGTSNGAGGIYISSAGTINVKDTIFDAPQFTPSSGQMGAVIFMSNGGSTLNAENITIQNYNGPANSVIRSTGTAIVKKSKFINNTVTLSSSGYVGESLFYIGSSGKLTVEQCIITGNTLAKNVVYMSSSASTTMNYNNIYDNSFNTTYEGGFKTNNGALNADYNYWGSNDKPSTPTVNNWVIEENGIFKLNDGSSLEKEIPVLIDETEPDYPSDAIFVATDGNDNNTGSADSPVATIAKGVELANAESGYLIIKEGVYTENNIALNSTVPIAIIGQGNVEINGNASSNSIFVMKGGAANFTNIRFTNNKPRYGGAINAGSNVNINVFIDNCTFENINSTSRGGAFYATSVKGNLKVKDSRFYNIDSGSWGAITIAMSSQSDGLSVDISGSTFENNKASNGAALYLRAANVNIVDSIFVNNTAANAPGAIYLYNATATIDNCVICNNTAGGKGVAITSTPVTNFVTTLTITNSIIEDNNGKDQVLPAIYADMNMIDISYSSLVNELSVETRTAAGYDAIYGQGVVIANNNWWGTNNPRDKVTGVNITLDNWAILNIEANVSEVLVGDNVKLTVDFSHVNTTSGEIEELTGGVIPKAFTVTLTSGSGTIQPATLEVAKGSSKSAVYTVADVDAVIYAQTGDAISTLSFAKGVEPYYGIIYVSKDGDDGNNGSESYPVASISKAVELALVSGGSGQIVISEGTYAGFDYHVTGNLSVTGVGNVVLDGENNGRLFYMNYGDNADLLQLSNLKIINVKHNYGAVVYSRAKELILENINVTNTVESSNLIQNTGKMTMLDCEIANHNGGNVISTSGSYDVIINNTVFRNNTVTASSSDYGIIYISSGSGNLIVENSKFIDSTTRQGVIIGSNTNEKIYVTSSEFINNRMQGTYASGGAINANNKLEVSDSIFINNTACGDGGAINIGIGGDGTITNSVFINNSAASGKRGDSIYNGKKLKINYCVLISNGANKVIYHNGGENDADAKYNWWGTNDNPKNLVGVGTYEDDWGDDADCVIDTSNWVIMTVSNNMTGEELNIGDKVEFTVDFTKYMDPTNTPKPLTGAIPEVEVNANAVYGELNTQKATTESNVVKFIYTAIEGGEDNVTIASSNAVNITSIDVKVPVVLEVIYVSVSGDDNNDGSRDAPVATLKHAIEIAERGKIVIFNGEYTISETLTIAKDLDIEGKGTVILKGVAGTNMMANSANLNLTNLQFTGASSSAQSILSDNGNTIISGCTFYSNTATGTGSGIINNLKGTMTITDSKFYENKAARGIISSQKETHLLINNSEFYDNDCTTLSASSKYGVLYLNAAYTEIENTEFRSNKLQKGGAIYASIASSSVSSSLDVNNVTFIANSANSGDGGAIVITGSNTKFEININNSKFIDNSAIASASNVGGSGAAVYMASTGKLTISNSLFINNTANNPNYGDAGIYANKGTVDVTNSVILAKEGDTKFAINKDGATITANDNFWGDNTKANTNVNVARWVIMNASYTSDESSLLNITAKFDKTNSTTGDIADYANTLPGGFDVTFTSSSGFLNEVVAVKDGQASVEYTLDKTDSSITVKSANAEITFPFAVKPSVIYVSPSGDDNNDGARETPVATLQHALEIAENGQIVILEGTYKTGNLGIISNDLNITGEGKVVIDADNNNRILYVGEDAKVVLKNLVMINGYAIDGSGALLGNSNYLTIINCTLANSSAGESNGGAIYNVGYLNIVDTIIENNTAREGGAIFTNDALAKGATITISNSIVENNVATGSDNFGGGAIFAQQVSGITIENSTFENNKALTTSSGGAIFVSHSTGIIKITDSEFIANHANGKENVGGGAIYMTGTSNYERKGTLSISNTLFEDNTADSNGGAIYVRATTLNIANSVLINNNDANNLTIYGYKTEQVSPSITANDNWWGSNDNPADLVGGNNYKQTISRWAILTFTNDSAIIAGNTVKLTASINSYTTGSENGTLSVPIKVKRPVTIKTTSRVVEGVLVNGEFAYDYTVPADLKIISATVDDQSETLFLITTETVVSVNNISAAKGDSAKVIVNVTTKDGLKVNVGTVEVYFDDDLVATIPVIDGSAIKEIIIGKDMGIHAITAKFTDETKEFGDSEAGATLNVTGVNNIVTPDKLSNFFDENGILKSDIPFDEIIFKGEFNNLGIFTINQAIKITGDNALFNNTALKITGDDVNVNNINFVADNAFDDKALIKITGRNVVLENNIVKYDAPKTADSYAILIDSADGLKLLNNNITYDAKFEDGIKTIAVYGIDSNNVVVKNNKFDISVPSEAVGYGPAPDYAPTYLSGGLSFQYCENLTLQGNDIDVAYSEASGAYDTLKAVLISEGNGAKVIGNDIELNGHGYAYGLGIDGKNILISNNAIDSKSDDYYSCGLNIEKDSTGTVDNNKVSASSNDVAYGVYADDWGMGSDITYTNNDVKAQANTAYGMSIAGKNINISNNDVNTNANYTIAVGVKGNATIANNKIVANASNVGKSNDPYPPMNPLETTGIYAEKSEVSITGNDVSSTGNNTVKLVNTTGTVKDNKLTAANGLKGDATISSADSKVVVDNNKTSEDPQPAVPIVKLTGKHVVMFYADKSRYLVLVTIDGKAASNVRVKITLNGRTGYVKTNAKGYAIFNIYNYNLIPKKYVITAQYNGVTVKNIVLVKPVLRANNAIIKKSARKVVLKAVLKKGKVAIRGKVVIFKFNGKNYKAKTNRYGIAQVALNKKIINKLKVGKKYPVRVTYLRSSVLKTAIVRK